VKLPCGWAVVVVVVVDDHEADVAAAAAAWREDEDDEDDEEEDDEDEGDQRSVDAMAGTRAPSGTTTAAPLTPPLTVVVVVVVDKEEEADRGGTTCARGPTTAWRPMTTSRSSSLASWGTTLEQRTTQSRCSTAPSPTTSKSGSDTSVVSTTTFSPSCAPSAVSHQLARNEPRTGMSTKEPTASSNTLTAHRRTKAWLAMGKEHGTCFPSTTHFVATAARLTPRPVATMLKGSAKSCHSNTSNASSGCLVRKDRETSSSGSDDSDDENGCQNRDPKVTRTPNAAPKLNTNAHKQSATACCRADENV
jgi:hypothetical protein